MSASSDVTGMFVLDARMVSWYLDARMDFGRDLGRMMRMLRPAGGAAEVHSIRFD
jgi:hypothetical protein